KRALFVGGATGIGRACAEDFARNGANVAIADINVDGAKELATELQQHDVKASGIHCDVLQESSITQAVKQAESDMGGIDTVLIFAAMMRTGNVVDFDAELWDTLFATNVRGTFLTAKHTVPALRRAGGGSIITTASLAGLRGAPGMAAYASTKGAVIAFTTTLALELAPDNIRVNSVLPGWIDTPFNNPAIDHMGGAASQAQLVEQIVPLGRQGTPP